MGFFTKSTSGGSKDGGSFHKGSRTPHGQEDSGHSRSAYLEADSFQHDASIRSEPPLEYSLVAANPNDSKNRRAARRSNEVIGAPPVSAVSLSDLPFTRDLSTTSTTSDEPQSSQQNRGGDGGGAILDVDETPHTASLHARMHHSSSSKAKSTTKVATSSSEPFGLRFLACLQDCLPQGQNQQQNGSRKRLRKTHSVPPPF